MRAVENVHLVKQDDSHSATFALADLCAKFYEERLNIAPPDIATCRTGEHQFESALMPSLHAEMVPESGTEQQALRRPLKSSA